LTSAPALGAPSLLSAAAQTALEELGWLDVVGVVEIDPDVSDTAASHSTYELPPDCLANCVVVGGKREGVERLAACVVLFTTRADINGMVRRHLDVRKASLLSMDDVVRRTGMEYGGITPIGLPTAWTVLIDRRVIETDVVLIGSGIRRSKLLLPGALLGELPGAEVVNDLGMPAAP
jgi:prolyl-tRNA editing enzyme YbaK/EbsC (Cys-tRNA(Pro) deacylase)